jgi:hypothetical protein
LRRFSEAAAGVMQASRHQWGLKKVLTGSSSSRRGDPFALFREVHTLFTNKGLTAHDWTPFFPSEQSKIPNLVFWLCIFYLKCILDAFINVIKVKKKFTSTCRVACVKRQNSVI